MNKIIFVLLLSVGVGLATAAEVIPEDRLSYTVHKANPFSGKPASTVMFGHGCNGPYRVHVSDWVQDLTRWGYNVVVVDSLGPRGLRSVCKANQHLYPHERMPEFYAVAERIQQQPWHKGKLGFIGFSHGGSLGLALSGEGRVFDAVVSYYPGCGPNAFKVRTLKIPTQIHASNSDTWTPPALCNDLVGVSERVTHQNATHSWDVRAPDRVLVGEFLRYSPDAAEVSLNATRRFFEENLK